MLATAAGLLLTFTTALRAADVPYVSGGAGADEREELLAKGRDYTLKIIVADRSGDYLADVKVVIESTRKERVLDTSDRYHRDAGLWQVDFRWPVSLQDARPHTVRVPPG